METKNTITTSNTSTREYWVDYLRIFASILVVVIHVSAAGWYEAELSLNWISANIGASLAHSAVPIFFMISGMFFLNPHKEISIKKLLTHNFLKIYSIYVVSMLGYGAWMLFKIHLAKSIPLDNWHAILSILFQGHTYLWFLSALCAIYLILPLLRMITIDEDRGKKVIEYYLILFILIRLSVYTIQAFQLSTLLNTTLNTYASFSTLNSYLSYFFLGYYLNTYSLPKRWLRILKSLFIPSIICLFGYPILQVYLEQPISAQIFDSFSIFTFITSANIFLLFKNMKKRTYSKKAEKILVTCSSCTFGVYILHAFVIDIFVYLGITIWIGPLYLTIPLYTIVIFVVSMLLSFILKQIWRFISDLRENS